MSYRKLALGKIKSINDSKEFVWNLSSFSTEDNFYLRFEHISGNKDLCFDKEFDSYKEMYTYLSGFWYAKLSLKPF